MTRILITGDVLRPGQEGNIAFLWAALHDRVTETFGVVPELVTGRPLGWHEWCQARIHGTHLYRQAWGYADLVIGFELPPAARGAVIHSINLRRHPLRFDARHVPFSVTTSWDMELTSPPLALRVPVVSAVQDVAAADDCAIMLQVASDAALLDGTKLLEPHELAEEMIRACAPHDRVWLVPHPQEPDTPWRNVLQRVLPAAKVGRQVAVWPGTAYEAMATMRHMVTVSSSTGFEAPFFGCKPTFLRLPPPPSAPYDLRDRKLWIELALGLVHA